MNHVEMRARSARSSVVLPPPPRGSVYPLERALLERRSVREFRRASISLPEASQLLWSAQGLVSLNGRRTVPSAGALYPLEVSLVASNVRDLAAGVYRYKPAQHRIACVLAGDCGRALAQAALEQACVEAAPAVIAIAMVERRITLKYGDRGLRYAHMEAGHAGQNVLLQAVALKLAAVPVGSFDDVAVRIAAGFRADESPLYLIAIGRPR